MKLKNIFKELLGICIITPLLYNFCSAETNVITYGDKYGFDCSDDDFTRCTYYLTPVETIYNSNMSNYSNYANSSLNFTSSYAGNQGDFLFLYNTDAYGNAIYNSAWFWYNSKLYFFNSVGLNYGIYEPDINSCGLSNCFAGQGFISDFCAVSSENVPECVRGSYRNNINLFYSGYNSSNFDGMYFGTRGMDGGWSRGPFLCMHGNDDLFYCFFSTTGSLNFPTNGRPMTYEQVLNIDGIGESPFSSSGGGSSSSGGGSEYILLGNDYQSTVNYFENRYNWDINMCYIGTFDTSSVYGTPGISFDYGTGESIFGLYYSLYSGFGNNNIKNVGIFINTWLINRDVWFLTSPLDRTFYAVYNGLDQNVSYVYTGSVPFPFKNNPVGIYFYTNMIFDQYLRSSTQGEEISYYCYLKLNESSFLSGDLSFTGTQAKVNQNIIDRIDTYNNDVIGNGNGLGLNTSGSWGFITSGGNGIVIPTFSGDTNWGYVVSGNNYNGDLDPSTVFDSLYNGVFSLVGVSNSGDGILPLRIVYPLLFLILFRIMKH